jgi:hypothetical protein
MPPFTVNWFWSISDREQIRSPFLWIAPVSGTFEKPKNRISFVVTQRTSLLHCAHQPILPSAVVRVAIKIVAVSHIVSVRFLFVCMS